MLFALVQLLLESQLRPVEKTTHSIRLSYSVAQQASTMESDISSDSAQQSRPILTSTGESIFSQTEPQTEPAKADSTSAAAQQQQRPRHTQSAPALSLPQINAAQYAPASKNSIQSLFENRPTSEQAQAEQISSKDLPKLSEYETKLLQRLSQRALYDEFHNVMIVNTRSHVKYVLSLRLFSTGAIRSAQIIESSGIAEIDRLAIQTAYRASPYPAPPASDAAQEFRYQIPIIYDRSALQ